MSPLSSAAVASFFVIGVSLLLGGCQSAPVNSPCGVIKDSLIGVNATTPDGQRRLNVHHERGAIVGCWK